MIWSKIVKLVDINRNYPPKIQSQVGNYSHTNLFCVAFPSWTSSVWTTSRVWWLTSRSFRIKLRQMAITCRMRSRLNWVLSRTNCMMRSVRGVTTTTLCSSMSRPSSVSSKTEKSFQAKIMKKETNKLEFIPIKLLSILLTDKFKVICILFINRSLDNRILF